MIDIERQIHDVIMDTCTAFNPSTGLTVGHFTIPTNEVCIDYSKECEGYICVGKNICFMRTDTGYSRRALQEKVLAIYNDLPNGKVISCRVTCVREYGAFVDIGYGTIGLIRRIEVAAPGCFEPAILLKPGDTICAAKIPSNNDKPSLSLRMVLPTFDEYMSNIYPGAAMKGIVCKIIDSGAFVSLGSNVVGMLGPYYDVKVGDGVDVFVCTTTHRTGKIRLTLANTYTLEKPFPLKLTYGANASNDVVDFWKYNSMRDDNRVYDFRR